jgi:hypothetical protein
MPYRGQALARWGARRPGPMRTAHRPPTRMPTVPTPQGPACIDIKATYATGLAAFNTLPPYGDVLNGTLPDTTVFTQTVCL